MRGSTGTLLFVFGRKRRLRNRFFGRKAKDAKTSLKILENNDTQKKFDERPLIKLNIDLIKKNLKEYISQTPAIQERLFAKTELGIKCPMIISRTRPKKKIGYINQAGGLMKEELKEI